MTLIIEGGLDIPIPRMIPIRQSFPTLEVKDVREKIKQLFVNDPRIKRIKKGDRIAVAVGSRGINSLDTIVYSFLEELKSLGAKPVIIPAMGSHGGATAEGQKEILEGYGLTETIMGVPIISSMKTEKIGQLNNNVPVYLDKIALSCDGIFVINRIKPHTSFKADYESGLIKMLAIGLGKHKGSTAYHSYGFDMFGTILPQIGKIVIENAPILGGLAIIENAYENIAHLDLVWKEELILREKELLDKAKKLMPKILVDNLNILIIHEMGKDISGCGLDSNITGRSPAPTFYKPDALKVERIVVLNLTPASNGNATGIGVADITTKKVINSMNLDYTYSNVITSMTLGAAKIPVYMQNDCEAIQVALKSCRKADCSNNRLVWIKNTRSLENIWVSESFLPEVINHKQIEILGQPRELNFDNNRNLVFDALF